MREKPAWEQKALEGRMTDWTHHPGHAITRAIAMGEVSARTVTEQHLAAITAHNPYLNAYTNVTAERALRKADKIDALRRAGQPLPPLAGVPYAVKNLMDVAGLTTRAGSKINRDNPPASADATVVTRLDAAGAVLLGSLNMGEYAYDFTGLNAHDGPSRNPHDTARMAGGSSGGSGAAAAGGLAALTIGSDTNGSIRVPASLCGLFGLKPTFGAISRAGTFPFVASLDHIGPLARSVEDLARAFDAVAGPDITDPVCRATAPPLTTAQLEEPITHLRIARAGDYFTRMATSQVHDAVSSVAQALGASSHVSLPEAHRARAAAFVITMTEAANLHRTRIRERPMDFDPQVRDRLIAGAMLPADWLIQAQRFRQWYQRTCLKLFSNVDVIIAPATPASAPLLDQKTFVLDGVELPVRPNLGLFTQPISFIGLPVVTVPVWLTNETMPIGVQIITAPGREDIALRVARALERAGTVQVKLPVI
jgi:1-carboxybiuret hydrolase